MMEPTKIQKEFNVKDFIGVFDNFVPSGECEKAIKLFNDYSKMNHTYNRLGSEKAGGHYKKDEALGLNFREDYLIYKDEIKNIMINFQMALDEYLRQTDITEFHKNLIYTGMKIQKTLPKEGYHVWHVEWNSTSFDQLQRCLVYSIYLNDVEEGGETEFLHFSKRVKPKTGRIVIWPAAFPYVHRGNPPLSGEKYMLTSWILADPNRN